MKLGLYSITYLGLWYHGKALTLEELIERAKQYGYEGVEIDGKRPHGNPLDMPKRRCEEMARFANDHGIEIYSVAANNDFSSPVPEHRESQLVYLRALIRMAADLGARTVRVFCAWPGVTRVPDGGSYDVSRRLWRIAHKNTSPAARWESCRQGLIEATRFAGDCGVTLALQNHPPVTDEDEDALRLVREVDSPHLKACLDVPMLKHQDEDSIWKIARAVGPLQVLSHFGGEYEREPDGSVRGDEFYLPFAKAMQEIGYEGYIGYELCHPLPKVDGVTVGIDFVHKNAELAAEFMRGVLAEARREGAGAAG